MRNDVDGDEYKEGSVCRDAEETRDPVDARSGRLGGRFVLLLSNGTVGRRRGGGGESEDDAFGHARRDVDGEG